jgi:hypothetical protein
MSTMNLTQDPYCARTSCDHIFLQTIRILPNSHNGMTLQSLNMSVPNPRVFLGEEHGGDELNAQFI